MRCFMVVLLCLLKHKHRTKGRSELFPLREEIRNIGTRLNCRFQSDTSPLHGETLATLSTTSGQHSTTTLGGHTSAEPVALGALALIRLISALHSIDSFIRFEGQ